MPQHPAGPRPKATHRDGTPSDRNDPKTPSIARIGHDAQTRARSPHYRMDCSWNKLLDEIHVLRLVRNSNRISRSLPPHHARNWNRISWPRASPQVHRAEIWRVGRVQTLDYWSDNGPCLCSHTTRNLRIRRPRRRLHRIEI